MKRPNNVLTQTKLQNRKKPTCHELEHNSRLLARTARVHPIATDWIAKPAVLVESAIAVRR